MGMKGLRSPWPTSLPSWVCARGLRVLLIRRTGLALPCSLCLPVGEAGGGHGARWETRWERDTVAVGRTCPGDAGQVKPCGEGQEWLRGIRESS